MDNFDKEMEELGRKIRMGHRLLWVMVFLSFMIKSAIIATIIWAIFKLVEHYTGG